MEESISKELGRLEIHLQAPHAIAPVVGSLLRILRWTHQCRGKTGLGTEHLRVLLLLELYCLTIRIQAKKRRNTESS